ncbi:hypothetical protein [Endozoicomonas sp. OPT23]|uniref:hypothetical protein n=1 Tax=Endozoicomonas sp. OPT23 TaxID=2072845 RepID=UPI00129ACBA6|nr:hypothetical protein [Endozoicomonas sp. OPT23]
MDSSIRTFKLPPTVEYSPYGERVATPTSKEQIRSVEANKQIPTTQEEQPPLLTKHLSTVIGISHEQVLAMLTSVSNKKENLAVISGLLKQSHNLSGAQSLRLVKWTAGNCDLDFLPSIVRKIGQLPATHINAFIEIVIQRSSNPDIKENLWLLFSQVQNKEAMDRLFQFGVDIDKTSPLEMSFGEQLLLRCSLTEFDFNLEYLKSLGTNIKKLINRIEPNGDPVFFRTQLSLLRKLGDIGADLSQLNSKGEHILLFLSKNNQMGSFDRELLNWLKSTFDLDLQLKSQEGMNAIEHQVQKFAYLEYSSSPVGLCDLIVNDPLCSLSDELLKKLKAWSQANLKSFSAEEELTHVCLIDVQEDKHIQLNIFDDLPFHSSSFLFDPETETLSKSSGSFEPGKILFIISAHGSVLSIGGYSGSELASILIKKLSPLSIQADTPTRFLLFSCNTATPPIKKFSPLSSYARKENAADQFARTWASLSKRSVSVTAYDGIIYGIDTTRRHVHLDESSRSTLLQKINKRLYGKYIPGNEVTTFVDQNGSVRKVTKSVR